MTKDEQILSLQQMLKQAQKNRLDLEIAKRIAVTISLMGKKGAEQKEGEVLQSIKQVEITIQRIKEVIHDIEDGKFILDPDALGSVDEEKPSAIVKSK